EELRELPSEVIEFVDCSNAPTGGGAIDHWRSGSRAAEQGWNDAGVRVFPRTVTLPTKPAPGPDAARLAKLVEGAIVRHEMYGEGLIMEVGGYGSMRKLKIRFPRHGVKTFVADKVKLEVIGLSEE